jgi:hypothetical protein
VVAAAMMARAQSTPAPTVTAETVTTNAAGADANGWGAHANRIVRDSAGNLFTTYVTPGADSQHFNWFLAEMAAGTTNWVNVPGATGIQDHVPGSPPQVVINANDEVFVIIISAFDSAAAGAPQIWDSNDGGMMTVPGTWMTGTELEDAGATYSSTYIDSDGNIWFNEDVPCPYFTNLAGFTPVTFCNSANSPGTYYLTERTTDGNWHEYQWTSDYRDGYNFFLPYPSGSIQAVGTRDILQDSEAPYFCDGDANGTGYCFDQTRDYFWDSGPTSPPNSTPVVMAAAGSSTPLDGAPIDHRADAADGYYDTYGGTHALYTFIDSTDGGDSLASPPVSPTYTDFNQHAVIDAGGTLHTGQVLAIPYVNDARILQDTSGRFWVYSVGPSSTDGTCYVFIQSGTDSDTDATSLKSMTSVQLPGPIDCSGIEDNFSASPRGGTALSNTIDGAIDLANSGDASESWVHYSIALSSGGGGSLAIATTSVPNGTEGVGYSQTLSATGGTSPYTWSIGGEGPPQGITLSSSGVLSGTPSGQSYPYQAEINVIVTDSASNTATETLPLLITAPVSITTTTVPNGTESVAYSQTLSASGGTTPYTWSTGAQGPPSGISLSSSGVLSGTPTGNTYPYQAEINVIVTDHLGSQSTEVLGLLINPSLTITTTSVPNGTEGVSYSQTLSATGGTAPYTWSTGAQGPPSGISLSSSGVLSGTPTGNTYPYQAEINVIVTDSLSHQGTEVLPLLISSSIALQTTSVPNGTQGVAYSQQLVATGGTSPYSWSINGGGPPSGISLSSGGLLSGTPTGNTYPYSTTINLKMTDANGNVGYGNLPITINSPISITTTSLPNGTQGAAYSQALAVTGGTSPYTWSINGTGPPSGLSLSSGGTLSGTPSGGTYPSTTTINIKVTDNSGNVALANLPITINSPVSITTASLPNGTEGTAYSQTLSATGGASPYTWSISGGGPPSGMSLSSGGVLSGTPSGNTYPFSTTINIKVTDNVGNVAYANFPITVSQNLTITTTSVSNGTQGTSYSTTLSAGGGVSPYTWSIGGQGPPSGISLSSGGVLSGTPTGNAYPYQAEINVIVTDSNGTQATEVLPLLINSSLTITTVSVPNGTHGTLYSQQLSATGGSGSYTWSTGAQGPPSGISLSSSGLLSGTPTGNTYPYNGNMNIIVTDGWGHQVTEVLPITIN